MSEALTANVCNASAYASSTDTEFEHEKCRRPLTLRVCTANVPVYVCLAITSVAMPLAIGAHWYDSSRGTRGLSAASIASKRGSTSSLLGLEEPASLEMVRRPKYNITENYFKSDFIPVPNLTAKQKECPALFLLVAYADSGPQPTWVERRENCQASASSGHWHFQLQRLGGHDGRLGGVESLGCPWVPYHSRWKTKPLGRHGIMGHWRHTGPEGSSD